jgi:membrane protein
VTPPSFRSFARLRRLVRLRSAWRLAVDVYEGFNRNDSWAIASHIALNALFALFPFLIFITALGSFLGTRDQVETIVALLFDALPARIAGPIAAEVETVLTGQRRDLLTIGAALALWFASSGIEALRVGLNRAYGVAERRSYWRTRLQSILFVIVAAVALPAFGFLVVLSPALKAGLDALLPDAIPLPANIDFLRYAITAAILIAALLLVHALLPAGRRSFGQVLPGILVTLVCWLVGGSAFALYLARFGTYASTYAGFAAVMIALVFLYLLALVFLAGGEINAALLRRQKTAEPR